MPRDSILLPDASVMDAVEAVVAGVGFPPKIETYVEPAQDYPGQELAVDLYAPTEAELAEALGRLMDVLADYRPRVSSVVDHRDTDHAGHRVVA